MTVFTFNIIKIFFLAAFSATLSLVLAPFLIDFLYKIKFWKKEARKKTITGEESVIVYHLNKEREVSIPRGGGVLIWFSVTLIIFLFFFLAHFFSSNSDFWWLKRLNFLSRGETWLPLFTLIASSLLGLFDDILQVFGDKVNGFLRHILLLGGKYVGGGMSLRRRLLVVVLIGLVGGLWFYYKLGWDSIHIPLIFNFPQGIDLFLGIWIIPLFILVMIASWSGGIIDGLDGLAGGVFTIIFSAFAVISFAQGSIDLAAFCVVIVGTLLGFLWFNIPPARFYMGESGILGLTSTMAVVAFLTDSLAVLPIIAGLLVLESSSIILQLFSKKIRKRKIFLATPIHHHFEAKGWPSYQVTMRFWIIGMILGIIGVAIRLLS